MEKRGDVVILNILVQNPFMRSGGAENRIRTLLQALVKRPDIDEVHFMFSGPEAHHQVEAGGKFHYWQIRKNHTKSVTENILRDYDIDVVQLHNNQIIGVEGIKLAQEKGIPTVWLMHDFWCVCHQRFLTKVWEADFTDLCYEINPQKCLDCVGAYNYLCTKREREVVQNCDVGIVPSERIRNIFYNVDFMKDKMIIVKPWIDLSLFKPIPEKAKKPYQVLYASGNFIPHKGINVLLRAWELVNRRLPEANLIAIGDQRSLRETVDLSKKLKLQNINLIQRVEQDKLKEIYYESALTIFPSIWEETIGLVWIESLAVGTPVICSATGSIPELLKEGGEMFEPRNHVELASTILDLLLSPSKRAKLAVAGNRYVHSEFRPERAADDFTKIYYRLEGENYEKNIKEKIEE